MEKLSHKKNGTWIVGLIARASAGLGLLLLLCYTTGRLESLRDTTVYVLPVLALAFLGVLLWLATKAGNGPGKATVLVVLAIVAYLGFRLGHESFWFGVRNKLSGADFLARTRAWALGINLTREEKPQWSSPSKVVVFDELPQFLREKVSRGTKVVTVAELQEGVRVVDIGRSRILFAGDNADSEEVAALVRQGNLYRVNRGEYVRGGAP